VDDHDIKVFADYFQFYVWDAGADPQPPEEYTDDDIRQMVKTAEHVVVIQPARNTTVPVRVEVHEAEPEVSLHAWDHVAECSVSLPTGWVQVHECTGGSRLDVQVVPGVYRVRALFAGLSSLTEDAQDGDDRYCVQLWPGTARPLRVVKQGWSLRVRKASRES
jgi:hypothetical protein